MSKRQLLLLSSSKVHGFEFLEYAAKDINDLLQKNNAKSVLFVPYALRDHEGYLKKVAKPFNHWGYQVEGIHTQDPKHAVKKAEAIFIGGGNTFRLLKALYDLEIIELIRKRILQDGIPYIGASAGTNVATRSIHTTNDMPIVYPPSFEALKLIPFNINPHYLDPEPESKHKGETREERILQYLEEEDSAMVLGLREGATLFVDGDTAILRGIHRARLFQRNKEPQEIEPDSDLSYLLKG
ncbi:alpha-aspartyl dipeptidase [Cylas formicarius]|uniref:alpha-aspartyl dipeptidase n=1 Tax=Cylas formicarius TaxID=197179 RepID=UPI00295840CB|nr:alpha-aspartyl dipeptidase [Cylas formicarius]XP_060517531.1 alpha-aspartyl dipeptidase [Cylas formicarius]